MSFEVHDGPAPEVGTEIYRQVLSSRPDAKEPVIEAVIDHLINRKRIDEEGETWLRLCLEEAVLNAMYHGNEGDPNLKVTVVVREDTARWIVTISDCGDGFSPSEVADTDDDEALLREHGRGLLLMREWLDELAYYCGGRTAVLMRAFSDESKPEQES